MSATVFVILSFEGPDRYARAGGLGTRVSELSMALAGMGHETHLFFIGDPHLPGEERTAGGRLVLHRWCQWISNHYCGVYDGEEAKLHDWNRSLPAGLERNLIEPSLDRGDEVVILAEEWQTSSVAASIGEIVARRGWGSRVRVLWNANNTFSFDRIDWRRLMNAAVITTVSRYMKHVMWRLGVNPRVVPNGISESWMTPTAPGAVAALRCLFGNRPSLVKVARWDPDKRWMMAIEAVAILKAAGERPVLLARGGVEAYGREVMERVRSLGLTVGSAEWSGDGPRELVRAIRPIADADIVILNGHLAPPQLKALYRSADAVLANSGIEPFGLVGLEAMASGGVAVVGCTGEDYATHRHDSISLQSDDPREIVHYVSLLRSSPTISSVLRKEGKRTAARYMWPLVVRRSLASVIEETGLAMRRPGTETDPEWMIAGPAVVRLSEISLAREPGPVPANASAA